eukprot:2177324-Karenia_brevis.AAC.1
MPQQNIPWIVPQGTDTHWGNQCALNTGQRGISYNGTKGSYIAYGVGDGLSVIGDPQSWQAHVWAKAPWGPGY